MKKYLVIFQEEFAETHEWDIQINTNSLKEAREQKEEMSGCSNVKA